MPKDIPPFKKGKFGHMRVSDMQLFIGSEEADVLNQLRNALSKLGHISVGAPSRHALLTNDSQGIALNTFPKVPIFMAQLSGNGPWYSFEEVQSDGSAWSVVSGGRSGSSNAREYNGTINLSGKVVQMECWPEELYRFFWSAIGPACPDAELCVTVLGCDPADDSLAVPEENATVEVYNDTTDALVDSGTTDVDGVACFSGLSSGQKYRVKVIAAFYTRDDIYVFFECVSIEITVGSGDCNSCLFSWPARLQLTSPFGIANLCKLVDHNGKVSYRGHHAVTHQGIGVEVIECGGQDWIELAGFTQCDPAVGFPVLIDELNQGGHGLTCSDFGSGPVTALVTYDLRCSTEIGVDESKVFLTARTYLCYDCLAERGGSIQPETYSGLILGVYEGCIPTGDFPNPESVCNPCDNGEFLPARVSNVILDPNAASAWCTPSLIESFDLDRLNTACINCDGECVELEFAIDFDQLGLSGGVQPVTIIDDVCRPTPPPEPEPIDRRLYSEEVLAPLGMIARAGRHRPRFERIAPPFEQPNNERQRISTSGGSAGSSTVTLQLNGVSGNEMTYGDTASQVKAALEASSQIDEVNVTGGPLGTANLEVEFVGTHAGTNVNQMDITIISPDWSVFITTLQDGGS